MVLTSVSVNGAEMLNKLGLVNLVASELLLVETGCSKLNDEFPNGRFSVDDEPEKEGRWVDLDPEAVERG